MSMLSGDLLYIYFFYNHMEISGNLGVTVKRWLAVVGTERCIDA